MIKKSAKQSKVIKQLQNDIFHEILYRWIENPDSGDWNLSAEEKKDGKILIHYGEDRETILELDDNLNIRIVGTSDTCNCAECTAKREEQAHD